MGTLLISWANAARLVAAKKAIQQYAANKSSLQIALFDTADCNSWGMQIAILPSRARG